MQNYSNSQNPQNSQFPNSRSGPAFNSPEHNRPLQHNQVQANTILQNPYQLRAEGFASPLQGAGAPAYPFYPQDQGHIPAQPVRYLSQRQMIQPPRYQAQTYASRPPVMELPSSYAESGISQQSLSLYERRVATQDSKQIFQLPPELFLLVTQPKIELKQGFFEVEGVNPRLKEIIEKNLIQSNKRVLAEFFNDTNKQPQDITAQIEILSSSLQTQYDSLKNPPRSTGQVARNLSSPQPMRPDEAGEADAKANNYLKLRLNAVIESLSQIESEQTYNEIKQCLSRLVEVNGEITLDQKHNNLLALSYQESRSSSPLSIPASLQQRENRGLAQSRLQELTRRIEELQTQNAEMLNLVSQSQKMLISESDKLKSANIKVDELTTQNIQLSNLSSANTAHSQSLSQENHLLQQSILELNLRLEKVRLNESKINLIAQLEIEIESVKQKIEELEFQKQELQSQLNDESQNNQNEKDQLNQRLQEKQTEIENQQKKITELGSLIALGKEGVESMNLEISEIQESLSQNLAEFEDEEAQYASELQEYHEYSNKIIAEKTVENMTINESKQGLENELSKLKRMLEISQSLIDQQRTALASDESVISRSHNALAQSEREKRILTVKLTETAEKLAISENARKELTGESVVEKWLPASEPSVKELTTGDIERFMKWSAIDLTNEEIINRFLAQQNPTAQQSPTLDQGTQTTDLPTQQLSEKIEAIVDGGARSALSIVEQVARERRFVSQQPDSSPSTSPRQTEENNQSRLMTEMHPSHDTMHT